MSEGAVAVRFRWRVGIVVMERESKVITMILSVKRSM